MFCELLHREEAREEPLLKQQARRELLAAFLQNQNGPCGSGDFADILQKMQL